MIRDILLSQRRVLEFYAPAEAAAFLGKAEFTVREWCRLGRVNAAQRARAIPGAGHLLRQTPPRPEGGNGLAQQKRVYAYAT